MTTSPKMGMPLVTAGQATASVYHNESIDMLDASLGMLILDRDLTAPPGGESQGDAYIPAAVATGAWAGLEDEIVIYINSAWSHFTPWEGLVIRVSDENKTLQYDGTNWINIEPLLNISYKYEYDDTTADADPGAGKFRLNQTDLSTATKLWVDDIAGDGTDVSAILAAVNSSNLILRDMTSEGWVHYRITGVTDKTGYWEFDLTFKAEIGTPEVLTDGGNVLIGYDGINCFNHNGLSSLQGGKAGEYYHHTAEEETFMAAGGLSGIEFGFDFDTDSVDTTTDPGGSLFKVNHATLASATEIAISDDDNNSNDTEPILGIIATGILMISDYYNPSKHAIFKITARTAEAGWSRMTIVHLVSNGSYVPIDEEHCKLSFYPMTIV